MTTLIEDLALLHHDRTQTAIHLADSAAPSADRASAYSQVVGLAQDAGLDFIHTLALLLKCETESQQQDGSAEMFSGRALLTTWPVRTLYGALRLAFDQETLGTIDDLNVLVSEMRLLGLDRVATDSRALEYYAKQHSLTRQQAAEVDAPTRREYGLRKEAWLRLNDELGEISLLREDRVLRVEAERQEFMHLFATEYLAERSQRARAEIARMALELLRQHPELGAADIQERLREEICKRREELEACERSAAYAQQSGGATRMNDAPEDLAETKLLLKKLAMLIHPDRLAELPLTDAQRQQLTRIWHDTNRLRADRSAGGMLSRSNEMLRYNVRRAQQILEMAGIEDLDPTATIRGATLEERVDWLNASCEAIEDRIASVQAELYVLGSDRELDYMRALLKAPLAVQEEERSTMKRDAERYRDEAREAEAALNQLLEAAAAATQGRVH